MTHSAPPPPITDPSLEDAAAPHRLAHQMVIDAGQAGDSSLLHAFDEAARAVDAQRDAQQLKVLHRFIDDAFEHHIKTMAATPEAFQRLVLEAAQAPEGHRGH